MKTSQVVVLKTRPDTVLSDYRGLMDLADYRSFFPKAEKIIIKLNLSWTKYFPACSTEPWQLEGVVKTLIEDGYAPSRILPVENKTVVTNPRRGAINNRWNSVFDRYDLTFLPLTEQRWTRYQFEGGLLKLNEIFPEGIEIPKMYIGKSIIHLPTMKTHGHSIITGSVKNAFGGLLKEVRHYAHKYIHEVLVDLMIMQRELHPVIFTVMDGSVCGDGAGPRTMLPRIKDYILASFDPVAIDAVAAHMMGFKPLEIPFLRMCHERYLGTADLSHIEVVGEDIDRINFGFKTKKSFVIWGDQMIRKGFLRFLERPLLHSPLIVWAPLASNIYHDYLWYPVVGKKRITEFMETQWGKLFGKYV